nr:hypothetical protein [Tanacetum cinerariifolium]
MNTPKCYKSNVTLWLLYGGGVAVAEVAVGGDCGGGGYGVGGCGVGDVVVARDGEWCRGSDKSGGGSIFGFAGNACRKSFPVAGGGGGRRLGMEKKSV